MLSSLKLSTQRWIQKNSWIVGCTFPTGNNVWKLQIRSAYSLNIDRKPVLTVSVLLSIRSWWTFDGNMTSISAANHSWKLPIFIVAGLACSIRKMDVNTPKFTNGSTDFVNCSANSCLTGTTLITSFMMKNSRCQKPQCDQNLERNGCGPSSLRKTGKSSLKHGNYLQCIFFVHTKVVPKSYFIKVTQWISPISKDSSGWPLYCMLVFF